MKTQWFNWAFSLMCSIGIGLTVSACSDDDDTPPEQKDPECTDHSDCNDGWSCEDEVCVEDPPDDGEDKECTKDSDCDDGQACQSNQCVDPDAECGNGIVEAGEECDDGEENGEPNKCNKSCDGITTPVCNNGVVEEGEECDDGNESETCNFDCTFASCGDGVLNETAGETCDDGEENGEPNKCNETCDGITEPVCGNGIVEEGEACDDGEDNGEPNQCNEECTGTTEAVCGNGVIEDGEACDDGEDNGEPNQCNEECTGTTEAVCGNGVIEEGELCDDGGESEECNDDCTLAECGDGIVNEAAGETCDDGDDNGLPNKCNETCDGTTEAICGNGIVEDGEACDDGTDNGLPNQCNENCTGTTASVCGNGIIEDGEICDDGQDNGQPNKCNENCSGITGAECGNGIVEEGEECDDGGESAECNSNCTFATCGDGITNEAAGETCDDGQENGEPNKCNETCDGTTEPVCGNGVVEDGETCDDGEDNGEPNQCNEECTGTTEAVCGNGVVEDGETCDDGQENGEPNQCNETCDGTTEAICGNGVVEEGEDCDEGGVDTDSCNADCTAAVCGDGYLNEEAGEECDEGEPTATCDENCMIIEEEDVVAFRITEAKIIDPHMYFSVILLGCNDVTNDGVAGNLPGGVNGMLAEALTDPSDEDPDVFNMSIALLARPLIQQSQAVFDAELRLPICDMNHENCTDDPDQPIVFTTATNRGSGACFPPSEHLGRTSSYGSVNNPTGPCFKSEPTDVSLSFADIELDLIEASVAAEYNDDPATKLVNGLLVGFLPKSVADEAEIEIDAPLVGGTYAISDFLGGAGGCGGSGDMDYYEGEDGWWMYLDFEATVVDSWTE